MRAVISDSYQSLPSHLVGAHRSVRGQEKLVNRLTVRPETRPSDAHSNRSAGTLNQKASLVHCHLNPLHELTSLDSANLHQRNKLVARVSAEEISRAHLIHQHGRNHSQRLIARLAAKRLVDLLE